MYGIQQSQLMNRDVIQEFVDGVNNAGMAAGIYYSLAANFYLNAGLKVNDPATLIAHQENVTQEEYETIAAFQLRELWSNYGDVAEIWFDGGYDPESPLADEIQQMMEQYQPDSVAFNGFGISDNPICWIGSESGITTGEGVWSTGTNAGEGDPDSTDVCPKACDTPSLQENSWFFEDGVNVRSTSELVDVYHSTVGKNGVLELGFAPNKDGLIDHHHVASYKRFGHWRRACYEDNVWGSVEGALRQPVVEIDICHGEYGNNVRTSAEIDRLILQENIEFGYAVRSFSIEYLNSYGEWQAIYNTDSGIGNKKIVLFDGLFESCRFKGE